MGTGENKHSMEESHLGSKTDFSGISYLSKGSK